jgi:hypothetical protein
MALLSIWASNSDAVLSLSIEQIVATAGDGKLRDDNECSQELMAFLAQVPSEKLAEYADYCLTSSFGKSGMVLQDIVNELGRRLDYLVTNGRYHGTSNAIGNDGLWRSPEDHDILVEVKTTDAYRIPLNTIAIYRDRLREEGKIGDSNSMLLVVGREDTGELEAQVRGSRHAWDMRLISIDSLVRLVKLKESTEGALTGSKIRSVLVPMEYTRLDSLIDVMFTAAKDVENTVDAEKQPIDEDTEERSNWEFTDPALMQEKRNQIISAFAKQHGEKLIRRSRALYWNSDHSFRTACAVSKRYTRNANVAYWYAYHPRWNDFLGDDVKGFFILGCMDLEIAFAMPVNVIRQHLEELNTTTKEDGTSYWHIKILEPQSGVYTLQMPRSGNHFSLSQYAFKVYQ